MGERRVVVPRMLSRQPSMWISIAVAAAGAVAVIAWFASKPETRLSALVLGVLYVGFVVVLLSRRVVIDTKRGTVTREMLWVLRRSAPWDEAKLQTTPAKVRLLSVGPSHIPIAADDLGGTRAQSPEFVTFLADQVERWAPGKRSVVRELRKLAELQSGR